MTWTTADLTPTAQGKAVPCSSQEAACSLHVRCFPAIKRRAAVALFTSVAVPWSSHAKHTSEGIRRRMVLHCVPLRFETTLSATLACTLNVMPAPTSTRSNPIPRHDRQFDSGELSYTLPAPLAHWIYITDGSGRTQLTPSSINGDYPFPCSPGIFGNSNRTEDQSGPQCTGICPSGFFCPIATSVPTPCRLGAFCRLFGIEPKTVYVRSWWLRCALCPLSPWFDPQWQVQLEVRGLLIAFQVPWAHAGISLARKNARSVLRGLDALLEAHLLKFARPVSTASRLGRRHVMTAQQARFR